MRSIYITEIGKKGKELGKRNSNSTIQVRKILKEND